MAKRILIVVVVSLGAFLSQAHGAEIRSATMGDAVYCNAVIEGEITAGDNAIFEALFTHSANEGNFTVCLESPGGNLREAIAIAKSIKERGFSTFVPADAVCISACAIVFLGGHCIVYGDAGAYENPCRILSGGATLGFHAPFIEALEASQAELFTSDEVRNIWTMSRDATREYATALEDFHVPFHLIIEILGVSPEEYAIVNTVGWAREMNITLLEVALEVTSAWDAIEGCSSVYGRDFLTALPQRETDEIRLQSFKTNEGFELVMARLGFLNYPYATWRVCRISFQNVDQGIYPEFVNGAGKTVISDCGRVMMIIPEDLEIPRPSFMLDQVGRVVLEHDVFYRDNCEGIASYFGPIARAWLTRADTSLSLQE